MKLVGFKRFVSKKDGTEYCVANVVSEYSPRENLNGCYGSKVEEVFLPAEKASVLKPSDIGKDIRMEYEVSGGRAYLIDFAVKGA